MDALWISMGFWSTYPRGSSGRSRARRNKPEPSSVSGNGRGGSGSSGGGYGFWFPLKQAAISSSLTFTGDAVAQVRDRWITRRLSQQESNEKDFLEHLLKNYDWFRALRMASYGFLLYGPGSYAWYKFLDRWMPEPTFATLSAKVILNQIVLGPCVIAVVFAWNNLWTGKLSQLSGKYQKDALRTLFMALDFGFLIVPLPLRVAFMSSCSIFWNFYLSTTISK